MSNATIGATTNPPESTATKPLEPHQYRLIVEFNELDAKVRKLEDFMVSPAFNDIDKAEQSRIRVQRGIMLQYIGILTMRINDFMNPGTEEEVKRFLYGADNAISVAEMVVEKGRLADENERLRRELNEALAELAEKSSLCRKLSDESQELYRGKVSAQATLRVREHELEKLREERDNLLLELAAIATIANGKGAQ